MPATGKGAVQPLTHLATTLDWLIVVVNWLVYNETVHLLTTGYGVP